MALSHIEWVRDQKCLIPPLPTVGAFRQKRGIKGDVLTVRYNPELKQRARELRKQGVLSEVLLWNQSKGRKLCGYQFMRQKPIGAYIVDFFFAASLDW